MSDMEQWTGTLKKIDFPVICNTWEKQAKYLIEKKGKHLEIFEDGSCCYQNSDCFYYEDQWYELNKREVVDSNTIYKADEVSNDKISFVLKYYNGSTYFDEALGEAIKRMKLRREKRNGKIS